MTYTLAEVTQVQNFAAKWAIVCQSPASRTSAALAQPWGALDTTFNGTPATPEPGTLVMFGSGLLGLASIAHRKFLL
jgi:hypothetical protein